MQDVKRDHVVKEVLRFIKCLGNKCPAIAFTSLQTLSVVPKPLLQVATTTVPLTTTLLYSGSLFSLIMHGKYKVKLKQTADCSHDSCMWTWWQWPPSAAALLPSGNPSIHQGSYINHARSSIMATLWLRRHSTRAHRYGESTGYGRSLTCVDGPFPPLTSTVSPTASSPTPPISGFQCMSTLGPVNRRSICSRLKFRVSGSIGD